MNFWNYFQLAKVRKIREKERIALQQLPFNYTPVQAIPLLTHLGFQLNGLITVF
jgi:hypothetical protein